MTTTPPTEAQMVTLDFMLHRAACSKFTFNEQEALRALLDEYARLREDAARLDWVLKECDVVYWWDQPKAHERSSIDIRDRAVIDAAREREGS